MKKITLFILGLLLCSQLFASPPAQKSAVSFYNSLINSIESAQGRVIFYLNEGYWKTKSGSTVILWNVDPLTKMTVIFQYGAGHLSYAKIKFNTPIHLQILNARCSSVRVDSLNFSEDGSVDVNPGIRWDNPACVSPSTLPNMMRALAFNTIPERLFNGYPFANITGWQSSNSNGNTTGPGRLQDLLYEIKFYPDINQAKALNVTLKANAPITFSSASGGKLFNNYIVLNPGSGFSFGDIDYRFDSQELSGNLLNFTMNVQRGAFTTADCMFDMAPGSAITLNNVSFYNSSSNSIIDASGGTVDASLTSASYINFNANPVNNKLLLQDNTHISLLGFRLAINENNATTIEMINGSKFYLKIAQGTLAFGAKGYMNIVNSEIDADLAGVFQSGQKPSVVGRISALSVTTTSGEVYPNDVSKLLIGSGNVHSNELFLNSTSAPYLTGTYDQFSVKIESPSIFAVPNSGLKLQTKYEGTISASDASKPLKFIDGYNFPTGSVTFNVPYDSFVNSSFKKLALFDGNFKATLFFDTNNSIFGTDINISGTMFLGVQLDQGHQTVPVAFNINSATLTYSTGHPQQFSGIVAAKITPPAGGSFTIVTPPSGHIQDHDDARVYSLKLNIGARGPIIIGPTQIGFNGADISLNYSANLAMNLLIPPGIGQYDGDGYTPTTSKGDGPSEIQHFQELARDKDFTSWFHVYLNNATYPIEGTLAVNYDDGKGKLIINLSNLQCPPVQFSQDGGGLLKGLGDVIAFLTNGFCGIIPFISCHVTDPSTAISNAISGQIAKKIQGFNTTWQINVDR